MIQLTDLKGLECRLLRPVAHHSGRLAPGSLGRIRYAYENLSRHLVVVEWEGGVRVPVYPEEIELLAAESRP
jgi:hypothetical protein